MSEIKLNLDSVNSRIVRAARLAGRDPDEIKLVAVSKTHPVLTITSALEAGVSAFGENRVREAETKIEEVGRDAAEWHLIGHLQSNKARLAVQLFDVIHSLDSLELAQRLERVCLDEGRSELRVLTQVDLAGEETKSGIDEGELPELVDYLKTCKCLRLDGLMVLPPLFDDPELTRPFFKKLRTIRDDLAGKGVFGGAEGELSMGMSHDFEVAIDEGSTMVRVGTAIFGARPQ